MSALSFHRALLFVLGIINELCAINSNTDGLIEIERLQITDSVYLPSEIRGVPKLTSKAFNSVD